MTSPEQDVLVRLFSAIEEVRIGGDEAAALMGSLPDRPEALDELSSIQRIAARALLKSVEQLQDLLARAIRLILLVEQENLDGFSARAIADRAEGLGLIASSDEWSVIVKLRDRLAHEYPLGRAVQLSRLHDADDARHRLAGIAGTIRNFAEARGHSE